MSISSSDGLSGSLSKSGLVNIKWHVLHVNVPSHAPNPSKSRLEFTTTSNKLSPTFPFALTRSPLARTNVISTLREKIFTSWLKEFHQHQLICYLSFIHSLSAESETSDKVSMSNEIVTPIEIDNSRKKFLWKSFYKNTRSFLFVTTKPLIQLLN